MKRNIFLFLIFGFCLSGLSGNVTEYHYGRGGMIYPIKSYSLSMEYEKIDIHVYGGSIDGDDKESFKNYYYIEYNCFYRFKNSGETQDFLMGFPVSFGNGGSSSCFESYTTNPAFSDFQLLKNGKPVDYALYIHGYNPGFADIKYDEVYGFTISVKKGETFTVEVVYTTIQVADFVSNIYPGVYYILKSGSTLKKPIGKADITVHIHFPGSVSINESPGEYTIKKTENNAGTKISWKLKNIIPKSDIVIPFDNIHEPIPIVRKELIEEIREKKHAGACFPLILARLNDDKQIEPVFSELKNNLISFYQYFLENNHTSANAAGFMLSDIINNPGLAPDETVVKKIIKKLEEKAAGYINKEIDLIKKLMADVKADTHNLEIKGAANKILDGFSYTGLAFLLSQSENQVLTYNFFIKSLFNGYEKAEFPDLKIRLADTVQAGYFRMLVDLLEKQEDNCGEIIRLMDNIVTRPESHLFHIELKKLIKELTSTIWYDKKKKEEARILEKLLHVLHLSFYDGFVSKKKVFTDLTDTVPLIFLLNRDLLRKAYYGLANFYFNSRSSKSIFFYKLGFVYGTISPLLDYLVIEGSICGYCVCGFITNLSYSIKSRIYERDVDEQIKWEDYRNNLSHDEYLDKWDEDTEKKQQKIEEMETLLNTCYKNQAPWWELLVGSDGSQDLSENAVSSLYTPERLLALDLSVWTREPVHDAPCYYIAYNMACAYSRIEKGKDAINWLKVAFALNSPQHSLRSNNCFKSGDELKHLAVKDPDLIYVREHYNRDFNNLLNVE